MTIHMQEAEAVRDFAKVLEHVAAGNEVRLERNGAALAVIRRPSDQGTGKTKTIEQTIAFLESREAEHGPLILDEDFEADMKKVREFWNQPLDTTRWD